MKNLTLSELQTVSGAGTYPFSNVYTKFMVGDNNCANYTVWCDEATGVDNRCIIIGFEAREWDFLLEGHHASFDSCCGLFIIANWNGYISGRVDVEHYGNRIKTKPSIKKA